MARFLQGYEETREITNKDLQVVSQIMVNYFTEGKTISPEKKEEAKTQIFNRINAIFESAKESKHYEIDALEKALIKAYGKDICNLTIDAYDTFSSISFWNEDNGYAETWGQNGKITYDGLNIVLGFDPRDYNKDKISAMGDFIQEMQKIVDKNPDFKKLDNALLVLKDVSTKVEQDIAKNDSYDMLEEKIIFEMRVEGKEPKEYEIVNSYKEYSLEERDLRETNYEYRVCELLNHISKDFIENRTYEIISSQDDSGYDNECLLSLDEDEWVDDRQLLTKDTTLYLSHFNENNRNYNNDWTYSALDIYDGRLYFSKELESKLDNLIEVLSSREDFDEDEFRNSFYEGINNQVDIAWQNNEIKDEIQYLLKNLNLENEIAIVTRKGKDFEIYPIASPGYTDDVNIVPLDINKEKIQAVMDGVDNIKNSFFEQELEFQIEQYGLSDEENKKLEELENKQNSKPNKQR